MLVILTTYSGSTAFWKSSETNRTCDQGGAIRVAAA